MYISHAWPYLEYSGYKLSIQPTNKNCVPCLIEENGIGYRTKEPEIRAVISRAFPTKTITVQYDRDPTYVPPKPQRGYFYTVEGDMLPIYINVFVESYEGPRLEFDMYVPSHKILGRGRLVPRFDSTTLKQIRLKLVENAKNLALYLDCNNNLDHTLAQVFDDKLTRSAGYKFDTSIANDIFKKVQEYEGRRKYPRND